MRSIILFLLSAPLFLAGQNLQLSLVKSFPIPLAQDLNVDQFGNIYYLEGNEIIKLQANGLNKQSYSHPRFGEINFFTIINPLQPLLYYADFNEVHLLDNRLNFSRSINLLDAGFIDPSLVTYTNQRQLLIFDQVSGRLSIYDPETKRLQNYSPAINQVNASPKRPTMMLSSYNNHLLYLPQEGFLIFDALAAYQKKINYQEKLVSADFNNELIACLNENGIIDIISIKTGQVQKLISPEQGIKRIILHNRSLYLWKDHFLYQYTLE
jgi:hypothetical protein